MDAQRALDIYQAKDTIPVNLEGVPVWIEKVDVDNGVATVQVGTRPTDTQTVNVERLQEG
ncbi:H-type small acid-soluble spore protein [Paenibacillus cellulositrophicus]|uniref:Small, acid-soluble spore protein, H family n=3 Tax=Paenibacillus TaxID=44249 RepID=A0A1R1ECL7_9BACL|nr:MULTISPECIES: H-type small acid-soluble spore protein [Paenibacillus]MBJ9991496.1 H-type small acid-soluble spore protein [Paenibacillus sp. S28]MCM2995968.1 H-type small acid-soluble spore protein [Paenibacillus cellulositrophicus]OMF49560.1 small, acid-soluble spore protein, H family [Paenibacillus rhizosphaerae]OXL87364.1 small, acid-soluble spore protein, H family [Paenibacillus sp. SSG-1]PQP90804.1 H-type small acid-soluble spore protein [Paenibacillus sp. AR247]